MAFPQAANVTYSVLKNSTFSIGRLGAAFNGQATQGSLYIEADLPTLIVGGGDPVQNNIWVESFDTSPPARTGSSSGTAGWFDNTTFRLNTADAMVGGGCYEYRFPAGQTGSPDGAAMRHNLEMTKTVDFSFKLRLDPVFPSDHVNHLILLMTNLDTGNGPPYGNPWVGPASTFCTAYINLIRGQLAVEFQANKSGVGWFVPAGGRGGSINDNTEHEVRCFYRLNTFTNGIPNADGIFRIWLDGTLVCENTGVQMVFEENVDPYFTQFFLGPNWNTSVPAPTQDVSILIDDLRLHVPSTDGGSEDPGEPVVVSGQYGRDDPFHRPPADMTVLYVDAVAGSDSNDGSRALPWRTLQHAIPLLQPGQELRIRPTATYVANETTPSYTTPSLHPSTSGTAQAPIIIRGDPEYDTKPRIARTVSGVDAPLIGAYRRDHIWFMDLEVDGEERVGRCLRLGHSSDVRVIRCNLHGVRRSDGDNTSPLGMEAVTRAYIYGNDIHDSYNDGSNTNASGVIKYECMDIVYSYNDFWNIPTGGAVKDKTAGQDNPNIPDGSSSYRNTFEYNRVQSTCADGYILAIQVSGDITNTTIRYNLFLCEQPIDGNYHNEAQADGLYNFEFHHNTCVGYLNTGLRPGMFGDNWRIHSNIFYTGRSSSGQAYDVRCGAPLSVFDEVGWNAFRHAARIMYGDINNNSGGSLLTVDSTNLQNTAPAWADSAAGDYRLSADSNLRFAGKKGTPVGAFGDVNSRHWAWWLPAYVNALYDPAYDPPEASMTWYWVDGEAGSDSNPGTEALPWRTLQHAIAQLDAAGKGLNIRPTATYLLNNTPVNGSTSSWSPSVQPTGSGTAELPIVIRKDPAYTAKPRIRRTQYIGHYILGVHPLTSAYGTVDHVWFIDLDVGNDMPQTAEADSIFALHWTVGSRIIRCDAHGARRTNGANPSGIRLEHTDSCHLYGNRIWDIKSHDGTWHWNLSCIKQYSTRNAKIHHNECWDSYAAYQDKNAANDTDDPRMSNPDLGSELNEVYKNFFHDVVAGIVLLQNGEEPAQDNKYHHNLILPNEIGVAAEYNTNNVSIEPNLRHHIYNNTIAGFTSSGIEVARHSSDWQIWNNLLVKASNTVNINDILTRDPSNSLASVTRLQYNAFRYAARVEDMTGASYAVDSTNLQNVDPLFQGAAAYDYRLQPASPCLGAADDGLAIGAFDPSDDWAWWTGAPILEEADESPFWSEQFDGWTGTVASLDSGVIWNDLEGTNNEAQTQGTGGITSATRSGSANEIWHSRPALFGDNAFMTNLVPPSREPGWAYGRIGNTDANQGIYVRWYVHAMPGYRWNSHNSKFMYLAAANSVSQWWEWQWRVALWMRPIGFASVRAHEGDGFNTAPQDQTLGRPFIHLYANQSGYYDANWDAATDAAKHGTFNGGEIMLYPNCLNGLRQSRPISYQQCLDQDFLIAGGRTRMFELYVKPNTAGAANGGAVRLWIDSALAMEYIDDPTAVWNPDDVASFYQRFIPRPANNSYPLSHIQISNYYGGSGDEPSQEQWVIYDGIAVSRAYIGQRPDSPAY